jgi:membrane fusion protein, multidrug efflux system
MKKLSVIIVVSIIVIVVIIRLGAGHKEDNKMPLTQAIADSPVTVNAVTVKKMTSDRSIELIGTLSALKEITITAETQGKIESINFEAGQQKAKGEVIAIIDNKLKQLSVKNAAINASKLKNDFDRIENLFKGGTASQQQLDDIRFSYENAMIQLNQAEKQLADATLVSPFSGIITQKTIELGSYVNVGSPIAVILDISKFKVKLNVSETNVYCLKVGDKAIITTDVYPGVSFDGRISFVSSQGDGTHNYPVEVIMNNSKQYPMKAGTFVTVNISISDPQMRLNIPRKALQGSTKDASVYVIENGKAMLKKIVIGVESNDFLEVVSGIFEGDNVVTVGQINLSDGKSVTLVK